MSITICWDVNYNMHFNLKWSADLFLRTQKSHLYLIYGKSSLPVLIANPRHSRSLQVGSATSFHTGSPKELSKRFPTWEEIGGSGVCSDKKHLQATGPCEVNYEERGVCAGQLQTALRYRKLLGWPHSWKEIQNEYVCVTERVYVFLLLLEGGKWSAKRH